MGSDEDKRLWIYGEFSGGFILQILDPSIAGPIVLLIVWQKYGALPLILLAAAAGALVIWLIVRWVNSRSERRQVEPPVQTPEAKSE